MEIKPIVASLDDFAPTQAWTQQEAQAHEPNDEEHEGSLNDDDSDLNLFRNSVRIDRQVDSQETQPVHLGLIDNLADLSRPSQNTKQHLLPSSQQSQDPSPLSQEVVPETPTRYDSTQNIPETQMEVDPEDDAKFDEGSNSHMIVPAVRSQSLPMETQIVAFSQLMDTPIRGPMKIAKQSQSVGEFAQDKGDYMQTQQVSYTHLLGPDKTSGPTLEAVNEEERENDVSSVVDYAVETPNTTTTPKSHVTPRANSINASTPVATPASNTPSLLRTKPPAYGLPISSQGMNCNGSILRRTQESENIGPFSELASIEETPIKRTRVEDTCVWIVYGTQWWAGYVEDDIFGALDPDARCQFRAMFGDGTYLERNHSQIKPFDVAAGDHVKTLHDKRYNYRVIRLLAKEQVSFNSRAIPIASDTPEVFVSSDKSYIELEQLKTKQRLTVPILSLYMSAAQIKAYLKAPGRTQINKIASIDRTLIGTRSAFRKVVAETESYAVGSTAVRQATKRPESLAKEPATQNDGGVNILLPRKSGIFDNCVFTISGLQEDEGRNVRELVANNGGTILVNGLGDLFEADLMKMQMKWRHQSDFRLHNVTFAAVLSRKPQRTTKYLEALALRWPCLSWRFIQEAIKLNSIAEWDKYVLAAGISTYLDDAYCSLDLTAFKQNWKLNRPLRYHFETKKSPLDSLQPLLLGSAQFHLAELDDNGLDDDQDPREVETEVRKMVHLLLLTCSHESYPVVSHTADPRLVIDFLPKTESLHNKEWLIQTIINGRVAT